MWQRIYPTIVRSIDIENNMKLLQFQPETKQNIFQVWEFGNSGFWWKWNSHWETGYYSDCTEINPLGKVYMLLLINTALWLSQKMIIGCLCFIWVHSSLFFLRSINGASRWSLDRWLNADSIHFGVMQLFTFQTNYT